MKFEMEFKKKTNLISGAIVIVVEFTFSFLQKSLFCQVFLYIYILDNDFYLDWVIDVRSIFL